MTSVQYAISPSQMYAISVADEMREAIAVITKYYNEQLQRNNKIRDNAVSRFIPGISEHTMLINFYKNLAGESFCEDDKDAWDFLYEIIARAEQAVFFHYGRAGWKIERHATVLIFNVQ